MVFGGVQLLFENGVSGGFQGVSRGFCGVLGGFPGVSGGFLDVSEGFPRVFGGFGEMSDAQGLSVLVRRVRLRICKKSTDSGHWCRASELVGNFLWMVAIAVP